MERTTTPLMGYGIVKQQPAVAVFAYIIINSDEITQMQLLNRYFALLGLFRYAYIRQCFTNIQTFEEGRLIVM